MTSIETKHYLDRIWRFCEDKTPWFLYKLNRIKEILKKDRNFLQRNSDTGEYEKRAITTEINVYISIFCRDDWGADVSFQCDNYVLDLTLKGQVIAEIKENHKTYIFKRKETKLVITANEMLLRVNIGDFIEYIQPVLTSNNIDQLYRVVNFVFMDSIYLKAIDYLTTLYMLSCETNRLTDKACNYYNSKYREIKYAITSKIWIKEVINKFSSDNLLLFSRLLWSLPQIIQDILDEADKRFQQYINMKKGAETNE